MCDQVLLYVYISIGFLLDRILLVPYTCLDFYLSQT